VSNSSDAKGKETPYELNISYFDAITDPKITDKDPQTAIRRFMVSQAIPLALSGMPAVYFHSLFGSHNDTDAVKKTKQNRSINRQKFPVEQLQSELEDSAGIRHGVYEQYAHLLRNRAASAAFHPLG